MKTFVEHIEYKVRTALSFGYLSRTGRVTIVKWKKLAGKIVNVNETWTHDTVKQAIEGFPSLYELLNEE